jgi:hypothetical protein
MDVELEVVAAFVPADLALRAAGPRPGLAQMKRPLVSPEIRLDGEGFVTEAASILLSSRLVAEFPVEVQLLSLSKGFVTIWALESLRIHMPIVPENWQYNTRSSKQNLSTLENTSTSSA